jgi:hypothetical protein
VQSNNLDRQECETVPRPNTLVLRLGYQLMHRPVSVDGHIACRLREYEQLNVASSVVGSERQGTVTCRFEIHTDVQCVSVEVMRT